MGKTLQDIVQESQEADLMAKTAAVQEMWGDDEARLELLDHAIDLVKEAQEEGSISGDLSPAALFTTAVGVVDDFIKEAEEELEYGIDYGIEDGDFELDGEPLSKEAAESLIATGEVFEEIIKTAGLTVDDLAELTPEEQQEVADWASEVYEEAYGAA